MCQPEEVQTSLWDVQMGSSTGTMVALLLLAVAAPFTQGVLSRGQATTGFATFYGGPQVRTLV